MTEKNGLNGSAGGSAGGSAKDPKHGQEPTEDVSDDDAEGNELGELREELTEEEATAPPAEVAELAASCVRFVTAKYKVMLDFTPETLSLCDQYLRDARADSAARPETVDLVTAAAGAYLGEVIRLRFGGYWQATGDHSSWRVLLSRVYLAFNPIGMAREALLLSDQDGWHAHFETDPGEREMVEARLRGLPEVDEDEYFSPTTRYEVVHVAYEALRAHMRDNGTSDVRFNPDDYR